MSRTGFVLQEARQHLPSPTILAKVEHQSGPLPCIPALYVLVRRDCSSCNQSVLHLHLICYIPCLRLFFLSTCGTPFPSLHSVAAANINSKLYKPCSPRITSHCSLVTSKKLSIGNRSATTAIIFDQYHCSCRCPICSAGCSSPSGELQRF